MALKTCRFCGGPIGPGAVKCPRCGGLTGIGALQSFGCAMTLLVTVPIIILVVLALIFAS